MKKILPIVLLIPCIVLGQESSEVRPALRSAIHQVASGERDAAIKTLQLMAERGSATEVSYFILGNLYAQRKDWARAASTFVSGAERFPLSARLHNGAGEAYEEQFALTKAIRYYRQAVALDPVIIYSGGGHYDPEFDAIYTPVVHDHRRRNSCGGRLYMTEEKFHYVVYYVSSSWSRGKDDSFELRYSDLQTVEVNRKRGGQPYGFTLGALFTNPRGRRRRIANDEPSRLDLKLIPKDKIRGYRGTPWEKDSVKLFFMDPAAGEKFLALLKSRGVHTTLRQ